jgi:hypothetical protein
MPKAPFPQEHELEVEKIDFAIKVDWADVR